MRQILLLAAVLLIPACGSGGGSDAPPPDPAAYPATPASGSGGTTGGGFLAPLAPVNTSSPNHTINTSQSADLITAALQTALNAGGIIVFNNAGPVTITLTAELYLPALLTAVIDGNNSVTLSGGNARRILQKGWQSTLTVQRLRFIDARTPSSGAAINVENWDGALTVIDCDFDNCRTTSAGPDIGGGAIRATGQTHLQISGCTFLDCWGSNGGAVVSLGCQLTIIDSSFDTCLAFGTGGGADQGASGQGGIGGAVYIDGVSQNAILPQFRLSGSVFRNNQANDHAGAVFGYTIDGTGSSTTVDACTFSGNVVSGINANVASSGAFYTQNGTTTFTDSTFDGNDSPGVAGGIFVSTPGTLTIANCTLQGNHADGLGGALFLSSGGATITNVTIADNSSDLFAAGIFRGSGTVTLKNTLLQNNTATDPWNGWAVNVQLTDGGNNLQWPVTRGPGGAADTLATAGVTLADALLQALAANSGPTRTMGLPLGSPALNAGTATGAPTVDQRGLPRVGATDIGAFERQ